MIPLSFRLMLIGAASLLMGLYLTYLANTAAAPPGLPWQVRLAGPLMIVVSPILFVDRFQEST